MPTGDEKPIYLIAVHNPDRKPGWLSKKTAAGVDAALAFGTYEAAESHARTDAEFDVYEVVEFARVPAPSEE